METIRVTGRREVQIVHKIETIRLPCALRLFLTAVLLLVPSPILKGQALNRHPYNARKQPWPIPGTIEAENFDEGTKEDPSYYDTTPGSEAPPDEHYRDSDVDIGVDPLENLADVGWVVSGEWLEYTVNVRKSGSYSITTRIATPKNSSHFHFEMDRRDISGSIAAPNTGCWGSDLHGHDCFREVVVTGIRLQKGIHRLRFCADGKPGEKDLFTVDKFRFQAK
jgi:hypothetical protein